MTSWITGVNSRGCRASAEYAGRPFVPKVIPELGVMVSPLILGLVLLDSSRSALGTSTSSPRLPCSLGRLGWSSGTGSRLHPGALNLISESHQNAGPRSPAGVIWRLTMCFLQGGPEHSWSGMVGIHYKVSKEEGLAAWLVATAVWFHRHEYRINLIEFLRIVEFQNPSFFRDIILVKNTQVQSLRSIRPSLAPSLKRACIPQTRLPVEIVSVENQ